MQTTETRMCRTYFLAALSALFVALFATFAWAAYPAPLKVPRSRGVVASDNIEASRAGAEILAKGGNAVDAAVATALALGVASPASSGLGGGGFLVFYRAKDQKVEALDFRETAPAAATRDMFLSDGKFVPNLSRVGGLAVAIPGEPAGLAALVAKYGKLKLADDARPAIRLALEGVPTSPYVAKAIGLWMNRNHPVPGDSILSLIAPGASGQPLAAGTRLQRRELAATLEKFGAHGADAFYRGEVAREIVAAVKAKGGILTEADLAGYRPRWSAPLEGHFRGHTVFTVPPPSGGLTLLEVLQILDARPSLASFGPGSSGHYHALAEAFKHAFADRARSLGDPAFVDVPAAHLTDPGYAKELASRIHDDKVAAPATYGDKHLADAPASAAHDHGTSHLCVIDGEGNAVALTSTINLLFGSGVIGGKSGVLLNDEMDDFSAQPGVPNTFGLIGGYANAIAPGKRPLSSMSPTIVVKDGQAVMCVGASGGPTIVTSSAQAIVNVLDHGLDANSAISSPRIHTQWMPDEVYADAEVPADVVENLRKRGQKVLPPKEIGAAQIIVVKGEWLEAASDPRKGGAPQ